MTSDAAVRKARRGTGRAAGDGKRAARIAGRLGMVCWGVVHVIVAYLALRVAFGDSGEQADQKGALAEIGSSTFGQVVLWVLAAGLVAFGLWQISLAVSGFGWERQRGRRTRKKAGAAVRGISVLALGFSAARIATGSGSGPGSSDQTQQEFTAKLLSLPAGPFLVVVVAVVVFGVAIASAVKGFTRGFLDDLDVSELPSGTGKWVRWLGTIGYVAKGVIYLVVAGLLGYAALRSDAKQAGGLDKALKTLAAQPFGVVLLVIVALGLAAFGVYCFAAARAHKS